MLNLFYRGYVIHEDIRSICYTVYGAKPDRAEMRSRGTVMEAMKWVDRDLAQVATLRWVCRDNALRSNNTSGLAQPAVL
ncbi:MAG TPA: hypothetical protein EYM38_02010 [Dehalococcoidia bacterium]|nr:hypothetical protein [Dehalococcoidia bacterium]